MEVWSSELHRIEVVELPIAGHSCQELYKGSSYIAHIVSAELSQATIDEFVREKPHAVQLETLDCVAVDASMCNVL